MKLERLIQFVAATLLIVASANGSKGLFVMTTGSKSNMNFFESIINALTSDGHDITLITPFDGKNNGAKIRRIIIEDKRDTLFGNKFESNFFSIVKVAINHIPEQCVAVLSNLEVQNVLREEYDYIMLAIFGTHCFLGYAYEKKLPIIYANQNTLMGGIGERFGVPYFHALSPSKFMGHTYPMTFWQRSRATIVDMILTVIFTTTIDSSMENLCRERKLWNADTPSFDKLHRLPSMLIVNSIRALEYPPKALTPNVVYAGGIHINPKNKISNEIQDWLDGSGEAGFILFSLGTAVRTSDMKESHLRILLNVFRSLEQRVIWKWDSTNIEGLPTNVKISTWLPQQEILAHPKIRLFITHGGLFSTMEATYFKVPIVGIPVYMDQTGNVAEVVAEGWGQMIAWEDLQEHKLRTAVNEAMNNKSYREIVEMRSRLMSDWPREAKEEVVYWINYAIRHKGAPHLQSPMNELHWYEIYNMDVWALFICVFLFAIFLISMTCIMCLSMLCTLSKIKNKTE